jgi:hypothetical protein
MVGGTLRLCYVHHAFYAHVPLRDGTYNSLLDHLSYQIVRVNRTLFKRFCLSKHIRVFKASSPPPGRLLGPHLRRGRFGLMWCGLP